MSYSKMTEIMIVNHKDTPRNCFRGVSPAIFTVYGLVYLLTSPPKSSIESIRNWMTYFGL